MLLVLDGCSGVLLILDSLLEIDRVYYIANLVVDPNPARPWKRAMYIPDQSIYAHSESLSSVEVGLLTRL